MRTFFLLLILLLAVTPGFTENQDEKIKQLEKRIEELEQKLAVGSKDSSSVELEEIRRQLQILAEEIEKLRSGEPDAEVTESKRKSLGLGESASAVYTKKQGPSIAGYGEMLYENFNSTTDAGGPSGRPDQIDYLRAVVYLGYRFSDRFLFNSEIEFEHANTDDGEVAVEFAHIDFALNDSTTLRGGLVLLPMGFVNEFHEPTAFLGTHRPLAETQIIPSTWRENGFGIAGQKGIVDYRAYVVAGLNAAGFLPSNLRSGRQGGSRSKLGDPAFVGRVDVHPVPGVTVGGSFYGGNSIVFGTSVPTDLEVPTIIGEVHGEYKRKGFQLRALYTQASLDNVAELNAVIGATGKSSIGEKLTGGYVEAGYNLLAGKNSQSLTPYVRFDAVNSQAEVPAGFTSDPTRDHSLWTFGLDYKPISNIVIKADYIAADNEGGTGVDQFSILLGYNF